MNDKKIIIININKTRRNLLKKKRKRKCIINKKIIYIIFVLFFCATSFNPYPQPKEIQSVNLFIATHKDFPNNIIINPAYKIVCDERSQLKREYKLEIIETSKNNILYPKRRGYSECAKIYPIWTLYKTGQLSSKYVGLFHYRRFFSFKNNIPDLDKIFRDYDVILPYKLHLEVSSREQYKKYHFVEFLDLCIDIVKEKFPEYYPYAISFFFFFEGNFFNVFIMKQNDFIKWGEFVFGVLLEFDKKLNLTSDNDIQLLIRNEKRKTVNRYNLEHNFRLEGFIIERLGNIFYDKHFSRRYERRLVKGKW